jgi:chromosome partitioning protein
LLVQSVVAVVSLKGGVGKTTVVLGLAGAAMERGQHVLVVDLDPQANATTALAPEKVTFTTNDVLADSRVGTLADAVVPSGWGNLVDVVPSEPALEHRQRVDAKGKEHRLRGAMSGLTGYDLVVIDCPPSLGELTKNALAAAHTALVVTEPTIFALSGAQQALDAIDVVRRGFNLRLKPAGIVVNRYQARNAEHRFRLQELARAYEHLVLPQTLPERAAVVSAQGAGVPVQRWPSGGARDLARVFEAYLDRVLETAASAGPLTNGSRR